MKGLLRVILLASFVTVLPASASAANGSGAGALKTYLVLFGFTSQGIENIKQSPSRVEAAKRTVASMGGRVKAFYGILGSEFDTLFIVEAPDDETVSKMVLTIAASGNVRTETHRLFTEEQYREIVSSLP